MTDSEKIIQVIEKDGMSARGKSEMVKYLNGKELTRGQAIKAKCYDCSGYYGDGKIDCKVTTCPLYQYMPYRDRSEDSQEQEGTEETEE